MRKPEGQSTKTVGYVVVPLFAADFSQKQLDQAIESESFEEVADVLNALQEQDEDLVDIIRELKERKGASKPFDLHRFREKVDVIGPAVDLERLTVSINIAIVDRIGSSWDEWYGRLSVYKQREGHCRVPGKHQEDGYALGVWVSNQRAAKDTMLPERRQRLEMLEFVWDILTDQWEKGFNYLQRFQQREGHCRVPGNHQEDGYPLGQWVSVQRRTKDSLSFERRQRLEMLEFVWDILTEQWEEGFNYLQRFHQREGHCRVPRRHQEDGYRLGQWVGVQRLRKDTLSSERRQRLEKLGFVWDSFTVQWEEGFSYLQRFHQREGHCRVPGKHQEDGYPLGFWVSNQRAIKDTMLPERRQRLEMLEFVWDILIDQWEEGFNYLQRFHQREGHCRVPQKHREGGYRLGQWAGQQRIVKATLSLDRWQRLETLGFVWDFPAEQWEEGFNYLQRFHQREGHCRVPRRHQEDGYRLGQWVVVQRLRKDTLSSERRQRLEKLRFVWDILAEQWEEGFNYLQRFQQREGHCRVPQKHEEDSYRLGQWVGVQRLRKDTLSSERRQRLKTLGFVWGILADQWEEAFNYLQRFHQREGHCRVRKRHKEDGYPLGHWVGRQRRAKDHLSTERRQRLENLGFVWEKPRRISSSLITAVPHSNQITRV